MLWAAGLALVVIALWLAGVILIGVGYARARGPWARYQALKAQDANVARYESWRGGRSSGAADETTGADVMRQMLRRRVVTWTIVGAAGVALIVAGFVIR